MIGIRDESDPLLLAGPRLLGSRFRTSFPFYRTLPHGSTNPPLSLTGNPKTDYDYLPICHGSATSVPGGKRSEFVMPTTCLNDFRCKENPALRLRLDL
jgi:hypothetical protein